MGRAGRPHPGRERAVDQPAADDVAAADPHRGAIGPGLVDLELAQLVGQVVGVAARDEIGRRALQHGDMAHLVGDGRDQGRGRGARSDQQDLLSFVVQIGRPGLRVDNAPLILIHARPLRGVALVVAVVALAHPKEVRRERQGLARVGPLGVNGPQARLARPCGAKDLVAVANVAGDIVLFDHLAHVFQDFVGRGDRRSRPRLEAIAEGVEVTVRPDPRVLVGKPGAAESFQRIQDHEAAFRGLILQVVGRAHAGNAGAHDQNIEVFSLVRRKRFPRSIHVDVPSYGRSEFLLATLRRLDPGQVSYQR